MEVKLDLHIHSEHSPDGRMALDEIVACARARGLQGVAVCDHDRALTETWDAPDFLLIPGIELSTDRGHLLGLFVTEQIEAQHQCCAFVGAFATDGNTDLHLCARRQAPHTGSAAGGRRCGSGVDAVFQNILVLHRAFLEVIVHLRFFGCNRADYALAECEHQCAVFGCRAERKDSGNGAGEKGESGLMR